MATTPRSLVQWQPDYSIDLPEIDEQHMALFVMINRLWDAIVRRADQPEVERILDDLEKYTLTHFTAEETLMGLTDYPGIAEHKAAHAQFMDQIAREKAKLASGKRLDMEMLNFLNDWLVQHIRISDRGYARFYIEKKTPKSMFQRLFGVFA